MTTELDTAQRRAQELVGTEELRRLGSVRADEAIAFARASAEDDPRYLEPDSPDFAVHPLYLPSMLRGPRGAVDQDYRSDGMFSDEVPGTAGLGVRLLAGGQDIEFHRSPPFGRPIEVARTVEAVERKGRPESEFLLITVLKTIRITGGRALATISEKFIVR